MNITLDENYMGEGPEQITVRLPIRLTAWCQEQVERINDLPLVPTRNATVAKDSKRVVVMDHCPPILRREHALDMKVQIAAFHKGEKVLDTLIS